MPCGERSVQLSCAGTLMLALVLSFCDVCWMPQSVFPSLFGSRLFGVFVRLGARAQHGRVVCRKRSGRGR